jgi:methionine synthase I (cobalamin-dependent)
MVKTTFGTTPEAFTRELDELDVDVIGLNCGMGPNHVLNALDKMRR